MLKNYFKIAFRNLLKNKVYSFINIFGLAIGIATTIMIGLWVHDEFSYNEYFKEKEDIARLFENRTVNGSVRTIPTVPRPLEFALREEFAEDFKHIVMSSWTYTKKMEYGDAILSVDGYFMQQDAPELFNLEIIKGKRNGLEEVNSIMLSESVAKSIFKNEDPIGKVLRVENQYDLMVTAVYKDLPESTFLKDMKFLATWEFYLSIENWVQQAESSWGNSSFGLYVQVNKNTTMEAVTSKIIDVKKKHAPNLAQFNPEIFLLSIEDMYLRSNFENGVQSGGRIDNIWLFGIIGCFVLLLACINFVNLSTARSEKRAVEVGVRKSVGSRRGALVLQFLSESFIVVLLAFIVSIGLVLLFLNGFNNLASKSIEFPWSNIIFWLLSLAFILITAFLAGSYPALYLSSFKPVSALKGNLKTGRSSVMPRKVLVVLQFSVSVMLIIGTMIVMNQINHAKNRPIGYQKEGLIQIPVWSDEFDGKADLMRNEFMASGGAVEMMASFSPMTAIFSTRRGFTWEGKPPQFQESFGYVSVSHEFAETLDLEILEGRSFSRNFASDSTAIILNKTAVEYMGIENPVGKYLRFTDPERASQLPPMKIIGVIDDIIMESPYSPVKQTIYGFNRSGDENFYTLRLNPNNAIAKNLSLIEDAFKGNFPNIPFEYQFVDEEYDKKFILEERIASLTKVFSLLAIFISCLGLFGLASFVAEQRTKEIGIRKVLGATVGQVWTLLSKDFLKLVLISLVIGCPIAYYLMNQWLQNFIYRTEISWIVFAIAGISALLIALVTVSFQSVKAAISNPVKSLRTE
ncbi:ABC transporter permease [Winogradskyella sp.]|uniref:ABC transporter permease n=1 Tax=Winogradskyella sp. TaxID=1883156 RepID=UPI00261B835B|nr:ABC transporter permease [Winogradskyella sp.]